MPQILIKELLTLSLDLLPALAYMWQHHSEQLRNVRLEQDVGSCEMLLIIKNDRDYLHSVHRKPGLFVKRTAGRVVF